VDAWSRARQRRQAQQRLQLQQLQQSRAGSPLTQAQLGHSEQGSEDDSRIAASMAAQKQTWTQTQS